MHFLGIDSSINGTGLHIIDVKGKSVYFKCVLIKSSNPLRKKGFGGQRLKLIYDNATATITDYLPEFAVLEQGAFSANSQHHKLGKAMGVCELALAIESVPYAYVEPSRLKKMITGKGRADKKELLEYMYTFSGIVRGTKGVTLDVSDAYALARVARFVYLHHNNPTLLYSRLPKGKRGPTAYQQGVLDTIVLNNP